MIKNSKMLWFWYLFAGHDPLGCLKDVRCSPLSALSSFENLAPALIITSKFDVLKSEAILYLQKLREAKVSTFHFEADGTHVGGFAYDDDVRRSFLKAWREIMEKN